jgi:hypothetical protein
MHVGNFLSVLKLPDKVPYSVGQVNIVADVITYIHTCESKKLYYTCEIGAIRVLRAGDVLGVKITD